MNYDRWFLNGSNRTAPLPDRPLKWTTRVRKCLTPEFNSRVRSIDDSNSLHRQSIEKSETFHGHHRAVR